MLTTTAIRIRHRHKVREPSSDFVQALAVVRHAVADSTVPRGDQFPDNLPTSKADACIFRPASKLLDATSVNADGKEYNIHTLLPSHLNSTAAYHVNFAAQTTLVP